MQSKIDELVIKNSLLTVDRLESLEKLVRQTENIPGDIAQVGVYKGGSARLILLNTKKACYLCDTFEGLPKESDKDNCHKEGDFKDTSLGKVGSILPNPPYHCLLMGIFPEETGQFLDRYKFSFVYIDVDLYKSTKDCLEFFYDKLTPGGILVSDDYEMPSCSGVKIAFDEFMKDKPEKLEFGAKYQCHFIKL